MLRDLEILNGEMTLKFDPLNMVYTINVQSDVTFLEFNYEVQDGYEVSIMGNELDYGLNEVILTVFNDKNRGEYHLFVYRESVDEVTSVANERQMLEVSDVKEEVWIYAVPVISSTCFLLILLFFTLLFRKKKKYKFK